MVYGASIHVMALVSSQVCKERELWLVADRYVLDIDSLIQWFDVCSNYNDRIIWLYPVIFFLFLFQKVKARPKRCQILM